MKAYERKVHEVPFFLKNGAAACRFLFLFLSVKMYCSIKGFCTGATKPVGGDRMMRAHPPSVSIPFDIYALCVLPNSAILLNGGNVAAVRPPPIYVWYLKDFYIPPNVGRVQTVVPRKCNPDSRSLI